MNSSPWDALAAPFAPTDLTWRVVKLSPDGLSAQVRPQLPLVVVTARLDAVLGVDGWSHDFAALGERGLSCTLTVGAAHKSAAIAYSELRGPEEAAEDAFVAAAGLFGLQATVLLTELPWVDYDAEQKDILYAPDLGAAQDLPQLGRNAPQEAVAPETPAPEMSVPEAPVPETAMGAEAPSPPPSESPKSAGQQAIDKLVDRLKAEGRGLQAARLLNTYGGYGSDPQAARELYAKLRELLLGGSAA